MTSRTRRWRGVRPTASAGPSGISRTSPRPGSAWLASLLPALATARSFSRGIWTGLTVAIIGREFKHLFERVAFLSRRRGTTRTCVRSNACSGSARQADRRTEAVEMHTAVRTTGHIGQTDPHGRVRLTRRGRLLVVLTVLVLLVVGFSMGRVSSQAAGS